MTAARGRGRTSTPGRAGTKPATGLGQPKRLDRRKDEAVLDQGAEQLKSILSSRSLRARAPAAMSDLWVGRAGVDLSLSGREDATQGLRAYARRFQATRERRRNAGGVEAGGGRVNASTEFRPPAASMVSKSDSLIWRVQIDKESDRRIQATGTTRRRASSRPSFERRPRPLPEAGNWLSGGLALAGAATIGATFALMNRAPDLSKRELAVVATEGSVRPQSGGQTVESSSSAGPLMQDSRPTEPSQVGALETRPDAMTAPARSSSRPAGGEAVPDAPPQPASFGLEFVAPGFAPAPANPAPAPVAPQTASQDGTPTATSPSAPASTGSALPAEASKPRANATATAYVSTEAAQPSTLKIDSARKPPGNRPCKGQPRVRKP